MQGKNWVNAPYKNLEIKGMEWDYVRNESLGGDGMGDLLKYGGGERQQEILATPDEGRGVGLSKVKLL